MSETTEERLQRLESEGLVPDGKWNRRVIRHACGSLAIHEVYYNADGSIKAWSENGLDAVDPEEGIQGLSDSVKATYEQCMDAISKPVLEWEDIPHGPN